MKTAKILILGAGGMLGHKLMQRMSERYEVTGTVRRSAEHYRRLDPFPSDRLVGGIDVLDRDAVAAVFERTRPGFVINCVGVIKQLEAATDPRTTIAVNAVFPHRLADLCRSGRARLIHISTDCVFSGSRGMYREADAPDASDLYGRTKFLGEVSGPHCLTLRTSIIGREMGSRNGLIEWFLASGPKEVRGYRKAVFSGLTTAAFARVLETVIEAPVELDGVYHVSSNPVSKYDLLLMVRDAFHLVGTILPSDTPVIDRSLDGTRFRKAMNYAPPSWPDMIRELAEDATPYGSWHESPPGLEG